MPPPDARVAVAPPRMKRSSPSIFASWLALPWGDTSGLPRLPRRQSCRCSQRRAGSTQSLPLQGSPLASYSDCTQGSELIQPAWSWALMMPGLTTASGQTTRVRPASCVTQSQPTQEMVPSSSTETPPPS